MVLGLVGMSNIRIYTSKFMHLANAFYWSQIHFKKLTSLQHTYRTWHYTYNIDVLNFKGTVRPKLAFCHHLLTLKLSSKSVWIAFFCWTQIRYSFGNQTFTIDIRGIFISFFVSQVHLNTFDKWLFSTIFWLSGFVRFSQSVIQ